MTRHRRAAGLVAATLVAAAGLVGLGAGPAAAAGCTTSGITAVVDYNDGAGGGTQSSCDRTTSSENAAKVFGDVGVKMDHNPDGSVCKVNGRGGAPCGRLGNQYWALWWSNGTSGKWVYSQSGVDGLNVPKNGSVAWAWQGPGGRRQPAVAAPVVRPAPTPKPTPKPSPKPKPTKAASPKQGASAAGTAAASASPSAAAKATATRSAVTPTASPTPSASATTSAAVPSDTPSESPGTAAEQPHTKLASAKQDSNGLPVWVPVAAVVALLAATGGVLWWRQASGGGPGAT